MPSSRLGRASGPHRHAGAGPHYFAAFDLTTNGAAIVVALLKSWTAAAASHGSGPDRGAGRSGGLCAGIRRVCSGCAGIGRIWLGFEDSDSEGAASAANAPGAAGYDPASDAPGPTLDSSETLGLPAARLTITFGFGAGLFEQDGKDR